MEDYEENLVNALGRTGEQQNGEENADQDGGDENEPIFHLPPPPEATYPNEMELEKAMHAWTLEHGYEVVRRASKKNAKGVLYKRYYHCSKHGYKANTGKLTEETRQRVNRNSNRIGCPMSLACVALDPTNPEGEWQLRHRKTHHNHAPIDGLQLAGHRRRARMGGVEKAVDGLFEIGTPTAQVLQFLHKTNPSGLFTRTDVANMKLRWRKWGTSADRLQAADHGRNAKKLGFPSACQVCRQKKMRCGSERPVCTNCAQSGSQCQYDHGAQNNDDSQMDEDAPSSQMDLTMTSPATEQPQNDLTPGDPGPSTQRGRPSIQQTAAQKQILESLAQFQRKHIAPERLTLESSAVQVLAHSSCGNGDSYKSLTPLYSNSGWPLFRDTFTEAAMKENTHDVLTGQKVAPREPLPKLPGKEIDAEIWNEYIKQLAFYTRRNELLLVGLRSNLAPTFCNRIQGMQNARDIWIVLEDICAPRGSENGFQLFLDLHSIMLANSQDLKDYIHRLQTVDHQFGLMKLNTSPPPPNKKAPEAVSGSDAVPEEMMCFMFLKGLGEEWRGWVDALCATNNIGGFGTGERLGFKELCKRALGQEALVRREVGQ